MLVSIAAFRRLLCALSVILAASRLDGGKAVRPTFDLPILVTQIPAGTAIEKRPPAIRQPPLGEGGRIVLVAPRGGGVRVLTTGFHSAADPDVSFNGKRFLFAGKPKAADDWNIYEMDVDGGGLRQITRGLGDCRSPSYQSTQYVLSASEPWYQITFVGTAHGTRDEVGGLPATALYTCRLDGTEAKRITFNLSSDYDPAIAWDGRLIYSSWQRANWDHGLWGQIKLFAANTDGSDYATFAGGAGCRVQHAPCTTAGMAYFIETDLAPWDGAGTLAAVQLRRPLKTYRPLTAAADGLLHYPSPLLDGTLLVSRRPADETGTHAVYLLNPADRSLRWVYDDPAMHDLQAKAVFARPEPDGRSSVIEESDRHARLYCLNIYQSDLKPPAWAPGTVRRVRLVEGLGPRQAERSSPLRFAQRRVLGEIPLAADGSFQVEVPSNTPLELQLLDEHGMTLRSCSWIWARSHQAQGCIGCHEDPELTPSNYVPESLAEDAPSVTPAVEARPTVEFRRDLAPLVAAKCAACHDAAGAPPLLAQGNDGEANARLAYAALTALDSAGSERQPRGKYVQPGKSRVSPLVWHILGKNASQPWDGDWTARQAKPIPSGKVEPPTEAERQRFIQWIDLGALWESEKQP